jgi:tetratricopeptide (TPR) repeat protein
MDLEKSSNAFAYSDAGIFDNLITIKAGRSNEAIPYFDKALQLNPNFPAAWYNKGYTLHLLGKYNEAIQCYDKALQLNPNFPAACNNKQVALNELKKKKGWFR